MIEIETLLAPASYSCYMPNITVVGAGRRPYVRTFASLVRRFGFMSTTFKCEVAEDSWLLMFIGAINQYRNQVKSASTDASLITDSHLKQYSFGFLID
jgi:hypothetical protein